MLDPVISYLTREEIKLWGKKPTVLHDYCMIFIAVEDIGYWFPHRGNAYLPLDGKHLAMISYQSMGKLLLLYSRYMAGMLNVLQCTRVL